ncbi:MAG TPA: hypothetical protein VL498_06965 [Terracidiphilus sp.]|nr:hypothetical protein [Terracidiphilus sp.]
MPHIIIPIQHQSAPTLKYDPGLARAAAELKGGREIRDRDWDQFDWAAVRQRTLDRKKMKNLDFDREFDTPGHYDPAISMLRRVENDPSAWVDENLELYESNREKAKRQHLPGQERWAEEHEKERMVNVLYASEVLRKLRAAGVDAREEEHRDARIWLNDWTRHGLVGVNAWVSPVAMDEAGYLEELAHVSTQRQKDLLFENYMACREGRKVRRTLTSLQDPGPEWSIMRFDEYGVATKEKYRGWRTAMLVLIVAEILTEEEVDKAFGRPIGEAGSWYRQQLKVYRQIKVGRPI